MEKLTPANIQFIDNYLKNSGVEFFDVRLEMTDHVASEIEERISKGDSRGFYLVFKDYMRVNKKVLLKSIRRYQWQADRKVLRMLFKNLYHPVSLMTTGAWAAIQILFFAVSKPDDFFYLVIYLVLLAIWLVPYLLVGRKNSLSLNRLALLYFIFFYIIQLVVDLNLIELNSIWTNSAIVLLNLSVIKTAYELFGFYKKNYELT